MSIQFLCEYFHKSLKGEQIRCFVTFGVLYLRCFVIRCFVTFGVLSHSVFCSFGVMSFGVLFFGVL